MGLNYVDIIVNQGSRSKGNRKQSCEWNQRVIFLLNVVWIFWIQNFFLYEYCSGNGTAEAILCESPSLNWEVQFIHQRAISIFPFQIYAFKKLIKNRTHLHRQHNWLQQSLLSILVVVLPESLLTILSVTISVVFTCVVFRYVYTDAWNNVFVTTFSFSGVILDSYVLNEIESTFIRALTVVVLKSYFQHHKLQILGCSSRAISKNFSG